MIDPDILERARTNVLERLDAQMKLIAYQGSVIAEHAQQMRRRFDWHTVWLAALTLAELLRWLVGR